MMRRLLAIWVLLLVAVCAGPSFGQLTFTGVGRGGVSSGSGVCAQATNFLARTSGLNGTHTTAYTTFLCGLETDGIGCSNTWNVLKVYATQDSTTALLNLCSASYATVANGSPSWAADQGYTGGSGKYLDPSFVPSTAGGFWTLNSATYGFYTRTSDTIATNQVEMGAIGPGAATNSYVQLLGAGPATSFHVNAQFGATTGVTPNIQGLYIFTRTGATTSVGYRNGSSFATNGETSTGLTDITMYTMALNNNGVAAFESSNQFAADYLGRGLSPTEATNFTTRLNTLATALGWNVF
jgi:hypothetical protein